MWTKSNNRICGPGLSLASSSALWRRRSTVPSFGSTGWSDADRPVQYCGTSPISQVRRCPAIAHPSEGATALRTSQADRRARLKARRVSSPVALRAVGAPRRMCQRADGDPTRRNVLTISPRLPKLILSGLRLRPLCVSVTGLPALARCASLPMAQFKRSIDARRRLDRFGHCAE